MLHTVFTLLLVDCLYFTAVFIFSSLLVNKVVNGIKYHLDIELADSMSCLNDIEPSTVGSCPIDLSTVRHCTMKLSKVFYLVSVIGEVMES